MRLLASLGLLALLSACTTPPRPYLEVGLGYQFNADPVLLEENGGGRMPATHIALGLEIGKHGYCEWNHWSHLRDGWPFNDRPETYKDEIVCGGRFVGK